MIQQIRNSKVSKVIATYLALMIFVESTQPMMMFALTEGPSQPEFNAFTPIGTSDMVDLASGDLNYNIPIMDVGGYPLNLAYSSGVTMDQEASWVGLGWDMNVGQISRQMRGLPDDFNGDPMIYENNIKDNVTVGAGLGVSVSLFGAGEFAESAGAISGGLTGGLGFKYNNYNGFSTSLNAGLNYQIADNLSVGMQMESSAEGGASVSPSVSLNAKDKKGNAKNISLTGSLGVSYNSRKGIENVTITASKASKFLSKISKGKLSDDISIGGTMSFLDASFTPSKRMSMISSNYMFDLNVGGHAFGLTGSVKTNGYYTKQGMNPSERYKEEKGYGYENSFSATQNDITDFNREKDRTVNRNTITLPVTNYTYDLYNIQGQGVSGMFRPYRSQIGYVFDKHVKDFSDGGALGIEAAVGAGAHWGFDGTVTDGYSSSGLWSHRNGALSRLQESNGANLDYEKVYFKNIGGMQVDNDNVLFDNVDNYSPIKFDINGDMFERGITNSYASKPNVTTPLKRNSRVNRNQSIQKLTATEVGKFGSRPTSISQYSKPHHTAEIKIIKEGGVKYVYGRALYNVVKKEVTFDASGNSFNNKDGIVQYSPGSDNTANNNADGDQYFNSIKTPAYAHTYLLTSVLSSDYQDLTNNGPSNDDLGTYTLFQYKRLDSNNRNLYKWRIPIIENHANFDEGLKSLYKDNKGNYQYGEKEITYIDKIITKTHVAVFQTSERKDSYGVKGENGGLDTASKMYKLDNVKLYSWPEYDALKEDATPIKTAHFVYDYDLCKGIHNNSTLVAETSNNVIANQGGKLTLKKVYFTYKNSKMGQYTPYVFTYCKDFMYKDVSYNTNFNYDMKSYDVWGNYKKPEDNIQQGNDVTNGNMTNAEFPFVIQDKILTDGCASAWHLNTIKLPSGGEMTLSYESDDYQYVQDQKAMQMFKVIGAGLSATSIGSNSLCDFRGVPNEYLYVEIPASETDGQKFIDNCIRNVPDGLLYFRFLLNMNKLDSFSNFAAAFDGTERVNKYDYVTGYAELEQSGHNLITVGSNRFAAIKIKNAKLGDGIDNNEPANAITKAGWNFARENLNRIAYGLTGNEDNKSAKAVILDILDAVPRLLEIFSSPNGILRDNGVARYFIPNKSWVRLMNPNSKKLGGGSRVKELKLSDDWNVMNENILDENLKQSYGQVYNYELEGKSSGVATYEPLGCKENPMVKPIYDKNKGSGLLLAGEAQNYIEAPLGESFFPAPKVTYSRVEVKNLPRSVIENGTTKHVKKHATGSVVTEFFTFKDYPTIASMTPISADYDKTPILLGLLKIVSTQHLTMTQGFAVHTNDMDGKMKKQSVYPEGLSSPISGVEYIYDNQANINGQGYLDNNITTINATGKIEKRLVGVDYDVINDFREDQSYSKTVGIKFNTAGLPLLFVFIIVPVPLPTFSKSDDRLKTAVTTKVIHSCGILRETIATDVGSKVSTKNLAWDAETGNILLTQTVNEFNDNYYSFNYPAYWNAGYKNMGQSVKNLDIEGRIETTQFNDSNKKGNGNYKISGNNIAEQFLTDGDEVWITPDKNVELFDSENNEITAQKSWVINVAGNTFNLINARGLKLNHGSLVSGSFKVIKSGYKNNQMDNMASITSMTNPLINNGVELGQLPDNLFDNSDSKKYKIINASAIEYNDEWQAQCESNLPKMRYDESGRLVFQYDNTDSSLDPSQVRDRSYNPYLYNILGNWRADKSYAYLTGRTTNLVANPTGDVSSNPDNRNTGYFKDFHPFYVFDSINKKWGITVDHITKWQFASEVAKYNPFGQEVENKDALERYSSAQYGYNYRFPLAVSSNSQYKEMGYDGFEDYDLLTDKTAAHFNFMDILEQYKTTVSSEQAHSGTKSIRLAPGQTSKRLTKKIVSCENGVESEFERNAKSRKKTK